ncbi:hypothetical protein SDC9_133537 [bioreactor metagenome]|uniref:DUF5348 domain-containing protein n=1 Tax=bioreactor metagenome TaxID=1076179 RepID=A0A645DBP9_9ZZZZ
MKTGTLFYNEGNDRMDVCFSDGSTHGGLHCGECLDVKIDGEYMPTRIEMGTEWYLVETVLRGVGALAGLKVRM